MPFLPLFGAAAGTDAQADAATLVRMRSLRYWSTTQVLVSRLLGRTQHRRSRPPLMLRL
jgi:hypothetical protein